MNPSSSSFTAVSYAPNGERYGDGVWQLDALSPKWLDVCEQIFDANGPIFEFNMGHQLSHFDINFTAGLAQLYVHKRSSVTAAMLNGSAADDGLLDVFCGKLPAYEPIQQLCSDVPAFIHAIRGESARPCCIAVIWGNPDIGDADYDANLQLLNHLAGAYLCKYAIS